MMDRAITGIHHITAIAGDPQRNLDFYTGVLGLRLVKLTVNFDDPGTYHFYFGNQAGAPGSIITFFPWPGIRQGVTGTGQVTAASFAIPPGSGDYWRRHIAEHGGLPRDGGVRFGEPVTHFADPDGLPLELIETARAPAPGHAISSFHSATLSEEGYEHTAALLSDTMGFTLAGTEGNRFRFTAGNGPAAIVDVLCTPDARPGRLGGGTVHHIAFRTPDDPQQREWRTGLAALGYDVSPVMDRGYFHSIYYREPGGVLFEIATDTPGFATDEPPHELGRRLRLPAQYEHLRASLEQKLPKLRLP